MRIRPWARSHGHCMTGTKITQQVVDYLRQHRLYLTTAEAGTAGRIIALLADVAGCGDVVESGSVIYSPHALHRLLGVSAETLRDFNVTSPEVAREMALGALRDSPANAVIATTGLCDGGDGTVGFAWGFVSAGGTQIFTRQQRFSGDLHAMQHAAALHALVNLREFHRHMLAGATRSDARRP